jgi:uncharacterized membrane protein YdbT with pleckstrin-like domain
MDENPLTHPGVPEEQYHRLGGKTLAIMILQRIQMSFVLVLASIGLFFLQHQDALIAQTGIPDLARYINFTAWICFVIAGFIFFIAFLLAWLDYSNYKFFLGDNSLKIKRGWLNKEEVAIPYRQIQDVNIDRDLSFRILGLSRIVILTAGEEDPKDNNHEGESEGILPAIDHDLAEWIQSQLLERANVQKVVMADPEEKND